MKLLLYSEYCYMPNNDVFKALEKNKKPLTCLFCAYAEENETNYIKRTKNNLSKVFNTIIDLTPAYKFNDKIDCIFVNGGSNFELVYKLKKYNQFNKLKNMVESGTLYIGNSAGSVLCSKNFLWTNEYEPPEIADCIAEENCNGFGFVDKNILAHASKYKIKQNQGLVFDKERWHNYVTIKLKQPNPLKIPNNGVAIVNNNNIKVKTYPWKKLVELNIKKTSK